MLLAQCVQLCYGGGGGEVAKGEYLFSPTANGSTSKPTKPA